jgi:hypothetical protein
MTKIFDSLRSVRVLCDCGRAQKPGYENACWICYFEVSSNAANEKNEFPDIFYQKGHRQHLRKPGTYKKTNLNDTKNKDMVKISRWRQKELS